MPIIKQSQPSYKTGYAKSASESAYPELWDGLAGAWVPSLGNTGHALLDLSGNGHNSTIWTNPYWDPRGVAFGLTTSNGYEVDLSWFDPSRFCQVSAFWYNGTPCEARTSCGMCHWGVGETEFLSRFSDANATSLRNALTLSGTKFDNTITGSAKVGRNLVAFQYDDGPNIGQQYFNGDLTETSGGTGTASAWTTHEIWGWASGSQLAMLGEDFSGSAILLYDRWLTRQELDALNADPLAPFRQRRTAIYSTQATAPPAFNHWYTRPGRKHRIVGSGVYV